MIRGFCRVLIREVSLQRFYATKMQTAVVRCVDSEDTLTLSFTYANPTYGIKERQFNFQRKQSEPLETAKVRIHENIKRQAMKKTKKKKSANDNSGESQQPNVFDVAVDVSVKDLVLSDDTACKQAFTDEAQLKIGDVIYDIVVNPPMVKSISLPTNIMAGFPVYPKYEVEFSDKKWCEFFWYKSINVLTTSETQKMDVAGSSNTSITKSQAESNKRPATVLDAVRDWEQVGTEFYYTTTAADIGRKLRVVCCPKSPNGKIGPTTQVISTVTVSAGPGRCPFDDRHEFTKILTEPGRFRFVSYNILADLYADSSFSRETLFPYCPPYALHIDYRKQLLMKEIMGYNADIVCLQEVDKKVYENDLQPALQADGCSGLFNIKGGKVAEGLACFFRDSKFELVDHKSIILADAIQSEPLFSDILEIIRKNDKLQERFLQRTTALQVVTLKSADAPERLLCIGNTHLYFHPDADHIRLLQAGSCLLYMEQIVAMTMSKNPNSKISVILCGDFNSTPEFGVYQLMTSQFIPEDYADWSSNKSEAVKGCSLGHSFQLTSACGTPMYTNFTVGFVGCLDYIYIDKTSLVVEQVIPFPSDEEMQQHTAIPSVTMPSDHLAVVCDLMWHKR